MFASFNGYILRGSATSETPQVKTSTINIYKDSENSKFFRDGATDTSLNMFKCSHLKKYICDNIGVDSNETNEVKLLRVNVNKEKIKEDFNENDIKNELKGTLMEDHKLFKEYFKDELAEADNGEDNESVKNIHIITIVPTSTAAGEKRYTDSESVGTEPKRLKYEYVPFREVFEKLKKNVFIKEPPKLYSDSEQYTTGRFYKSEIPISGNDYIDMRLDDKHTTNSGRYLLRKLRDAHEGRYLLYAVSGAGKTRAIFDIAMNNDGIYVVYMECRSVDDIQLESTRNGNFARLVYSIRSTFARHNYELAREEAKCLIRLEIAARIFYLILLKERFPNIKSRDYLIAQINGGQESVISIIDELILEYENIDLVPIIDSALNHLKNKLVGQKSLIFAIDEANVALFNGDFRNHHGKPHGLLPLIVGTLNLFRVSIIVSSTSFFLKQGFEVRSGIGKVNNSVIFTDFTTTKSEDVENYINRYLNLSDCNIKDIENSKYLVGRPCLAAHLVKEIINAEKESQESKQIVLEAAVNKTVLSFENDMTCHLEAIVNEAYGKEDLGNVELQEILMTLFINCWFFNGYVSKCKINAYSAKLVDCGIASLKSDKDKIFWQVKELLAIEVVKTVLFFRYNKPTKPLIEKLFYELCYNDSSNTSKGIIWQYFVIGRLMDFKNKTVSEFVNEIYSDDQPHLPDWTRKAIINIESYGDLKMFSRLDVKLKDDVDIIESLLYKSRFSKYMLVPGHLVHPDGIYIRKLDSVTYWTLLISAKMYTNKLSGKDVDDDKRSTDWSLLYHQKNGEVVCKTLKQRLDDVCHKDFTCQGSLRIHYILPGVTQENTSNQSNRSNRSGCYTENNDVIMYIDEKLLERYFQREDTVYIYILGILERILKELNLD